MKNDFIMTLIRDWPDLLWIPVALVAVERGKKVLTVLFVLACILLLRLQRELMAEIGYPRGIFGLIGMDVFTRGLIAYGLFIGLFLVLAFYSKGGDGHVHIAASISLMIMAFCLSSLVMVL